MRHSGPTLESLTARIADTPPDFLAAPRTTDPKTCQGAVHVDAVVGDLLACLGDRLPTAELARFGANTTPQDHNRLAVALLICWLLADSWFARARLAPRDLLRAIEAVSAGLANTAAARHFYTDPDRREELARTLLAALDHRPAGESETQSQDRLISVSATERKRTVEAARGAAERARAIREALARKAAEESADKMWRE